MSADGEQTKLVLVGVDNGGEDFSVALWKGTFDEVVAELSRRITNEAGAKRFEVREVTVTRAVELTRGVDVKDITP